MLPDEDAINSILRPFVEPWYDSLENPQKAQEQVLADLLQKYATTDYGESHGAAKTTSIMDYQANFPIINYSELTPHLTEVKERGYRSFLSEPPECWVMTRGSTGKSKVFFYYFDQHPDYPADSQQAGRGSPHGQEVAYVFQHLNPNQQTTKSDEAISEAIATYWTNFAKFGDPNGPGLPRWPAYSDANSVLMYFSQTPHIGPVPSADALKIMDQYFAWRRSPEGEAFVK
jgi:carboxylesterase type B